jgi:hypothetical protein
VAIPGWFDEDGEPVTSAVIVKGEAPPEKQKPNGFVSFEKAWWKTGAEERGGAPYLTRSALIEFGEANGLEGTKSKRIRDVVKDDLVSGSFIAPLIAAKLIAPHEKHGWIVIDLGTATGMMLKKNS